MSATPTPLSLACADRLLAEALGKPWAAMEAGPAAYDCWGLVWAVRHAARLPCPRWPALTSEERAGFQRLAQPAPLCLVAMGSSLACTHVGVYHVSGVVYHSSEGRGVHGTQLTALQRTHRLVQFWSIE